MPFCIVCGHQYSSDVTACPSCNRPVPVTTAPTRTTVTVEGGQRAIKLRRFIAGTIDVLLLILLMYALLRIKRYAAMLLVKRATWFIVPSVYFLARDVVFGRSIGKVVMGIKVTEDVTGQRPSLMQLIGRNIIFAVPLIGPTVFVAIAAFQIVTGARVRFGEDVSGTKVVVE